MRIGSETSEPLIKRVEIEHYHPSFPGYELIDDLTFDSGVTCGCPADVNGNGSVDFTDILAVIGNWGPCPTS